MSNRYFHRRCCWTIAEDCRSSTSSSYSLCAIHARYSHPSLIAIFQRFWRIGSTDSCICLSLMIFSDSFYRKIGYGLLFWLDSSLQMFYIIRFSQIREQYIKSSFLLIHQPFKSNYYYFSLFIYFYFIWGLHFLSLLFYGLSWISLLSLFEIIRI